MLVSNPLTTLKYWNTATHVWISKFAPFWARSTRARRRPATGISTG